MRNISDAELKSASVPQLNHICEELRTEIFDTVSVCGGHLSSNLGTVELTVALHKVFDFPRDKIVFDVGHQCYTHKLLSGRADRFRTLRQEGGLSGFPKREESDYDCYDTGHAGTSVSAALGIAAARDLKGETFEVIALIGDGSFNNGLIFEALNSLHILNTRILIVVNDNGLSISPTVGGTHDVLSELKTGMRPENIALFEQYGLKYMGVYNGNDLSELLPALEEAKKALRDSCVLLHVVTKKGQGYPFCESEPEATHGVGPKSGEGEREYSAALGEELCALAERDPRIVAVTAAMTDSLGLREFFRRFPRRAFDVGICEEHASVLCAGMATQGMRPYYAIYSTFLQRAFDEIIHDVCAQNLPVTFCVDRAGIAGPDGQTHQGIFDLSYLSFIPNLTVAIPKNVGEFRAILRAGASFDGPLAIRYPRAGLDGPISPLEIGKMEILHSTTSDIMIIAAGERCICIAERVRTALRGSGKDVGIVNARFLKPLDEALLGGLPQKYVITVEDNALIGGLGDAVARFYRNSGKEVYSLGYRDEFIPHGQPKSLAKRFGVSEEALFALIGGLYARG